MILKSKFFDFKIMFSHEIKERRQYSKCESKMVGYSLGFSTDFFTKMVYTKYLLSLKKRLDPEYWFSPNKTFDINFPSFCSRSKSKSFFCSCMGPWLFTFLQSNSLLHLSFSFFNILLAKTCLAIL